MIELHRIYRSALRRRSQICGIAEHLGQRHECFDDLRAGAHLHALDLPTAGVEIADDIAHEVFRRSDLDLHDRLENDRLAAANRFLERQRSGDLVGNFLGVDIVVRTVDEGRLDIDERVSGLRRQ